MAINVNVGMLGTKETKYVRSLWPLTTKIVLSRTTSLPGSPTDGDIYIVPDAAITNPNQVAFRSEGAWLFLEPEEGWLAYVLDDSMLVLFDGTDWNELETGGGGGGDTIELSVSVSGRPTSSEVVFRYTASAGFTLPAGLVGSVGSAGTAATASTVLTVKKGATSVGSATWAASGTIPTFAMASATTFSVGDVMTIVAPSTQDTTLAGISLSIVGTLS